MDREGQGDQLEFFESGSLVLESMFFFNETSTFNLIHKHVHPGEVKVVVNLFLNQCLEYVVSPIIF